MIPKDVQIKEVDFFYDSCIKGMTFFDQDGEVIFQFGVRDQNLLTETVVLEEHEMIVGVAEIFFQGWRVSTLTFNL